MNNKENSYLPLHDTSAFHRRLKSRKRVIKSFEAKENANRKFAERIADFMTARFGSMTFLTINMAFFLIWIIVNIGLMPGAIPFDPFPFGLLTTIVSLEAIFLATIVLISQNRGARIDDLRDEIELQISTIAEEEITKMMELQVMLLKKHGIDLTQDQELQQMLEPTNTDTIEKALEKEFK